MHEEIIGGISGKGNKTTVALEAKIMAVYRVIYEKFWTDSNVAECSKDEKLFLLFSLSNPQANISGCYEVTIKQMSEYTGLDAGEIKAILEKFAKLNKFVEYDWDTKELFVKNWFIYNWSDTPSIDRRLREEISSIKNESFKETLIERYNMRKTVLDGRSECLDEFGKTVESYDANEEEEEKVVIHNPGEKRPYIPYSKICDMWNEICVSYPRLRSCEGKRRQNIAARWRQNPSMDVFRQVFENAERSQFMKGYNNRGWTATFDWIMLPSNFQKVLEGNYNQDKYNAFPRNNEGIRSNPDDGWSVIKQIAEGGDHNDERRNGGVSIGSESGISDVLQ